MQLYIGDIASFDSKSLRQGLYSRSMVSALMHADGDLDV